MFTHGSTTSGRNGKGTCYETDRRTRWANARWKSGRPRWSVRREGGTTGKTAGCENDEGRTRGRKGSGGYGPGTREREGSTSNHTTNTYTHTTPHIPITAQPQQYHAGSSRTLHTTGRGEARPTGCRSRTGAPCNKGVGDVGTGPNSRTEQNTTVSPPQTRPDNGIAARLSSALAGRAASPCGGAKQPAPHALRRVVLLEWPGSLPP